MVLTFRLIILWWLISFENNNNKKRLKFACKKYCVKYFLNNSHVPNDSQWTQKHLNVIVFTIKATWDISLTIVAHCLSIFIFLLMMLTLFRKYYINKNFINIVSEVLGVAKIIYILSMRHKKENIKGASILDFLSSLSLQVNFTHSDYFLICKQ